MIGAFSGLVVTTISSGLGGVSSSGSAVSQYGQGSAPVTQTPTVSSTFGLGGTFVGLFAVLISASLLAGLVILVVANRADPDPTGRRPQSVAHFAIAFVTLTTSIIGSAVVLGSLIQLVGSHSSDITNTVARSAVAGGLITAVSLALLVTQLGRGVAIARSDDQDAGPSRRVGQSYVSLATFVAVLSVLVTTVLAGYLLFVLADPSVFGAVGGRGTTTRVLVITVYLGMVALVVRASHRNLVPPLSQPNSGLGGAAGPVSPAPVPPL